MLCTHCYGDEYVGTLPDLDFSTSCHSIFLTTHIAYMPFIKKLLNFSTATDHIDVQPAMLYKNS